MPEQDFTNREINAMFGNVLDKLNEQNITSEKNRSEDTLIRKEILAAVNLTNGKISDVQAWRERMNGGTLVASVFLTFIVIPILTWSVYTLVKLPETMHATIQDAFSEYEINEDFLK